MHGTSNDNAAMRVLWSEHSRQWAGLDYVYPVISRRSGGLSIGINLSQEKACNLDCVYCQVDRSDRFDQTGSNRVDLDQLRDELDWILDWAVSGKIWLHDRFAAAPEACRRLNDIAFSGDGEPTMYPRFDDACSLVAQVKAAHRLTSVKLIVLSNMSLCRRAAVQRGFGVLDRNNGEIWAKLDAGRASWHQLIARSKIGFNSTLANIRNTGRIRPLVIQTMLMSRCGVPMPFEEFDAYLRCIGDLIRDGCRIKRVQLYTIARRPAESFVSPLTDDELDRYGRRFRQCFGEMPCQIGYGVA
jgi:wyosine [tRNA(Phe)-imidazoG37] synthetase (radical SAM superfamily)